MKVFLNGRNITEEDSRRQKTHHPEYCPDNVIESEFGIPHLANAGDKGGEGSDNGNETRDDDRFAAVLIVELLGSGQMLSIKEPRCLTSKNSGADAPSNGVIDRISQDRSHRKKDGKQRKGEDRLISDGKCP